MVHSAAMGARVPDLAALCPDAKSLLTVPAQPSQSLAQVQAPPLFASLPWPPLLRLLHRQSSVSVNVSSRRLCSPPGSIDSSSTPTVMLRSAPEAKMTTTKVVQFSAIHSGIEHKQVNPGVYGVERVCSTKVLSFFKYQSANMESAMEQEVPEGGEQKSDVAIVANLFSLKNVPPTRFSLTGCVVLVGAIL
ncbi:uncharacterized protein LOC119364142 isoform X1 [Triticum dicoccoides]|uniref:uncharacterized protein LOC119364142 isoform X1 n=1 Tax=Triticum dicoccoides TaxID=85692 RepID=UPI0018901B38|nr:uncharacterized protein LOC119364142 isoform X1 [Triticum dicoccoides]XP_044324293.1 uncharacterized protein LOC123045343 isoform X1 [Triticum aestivum]